jgi:hypothetical protein
MADDTVLGQAAQGGIGPEQAPIQANALEMAGQEQAQQPPQISPIEAFVGGVIAHEGLEPFQTPFRITNDKMKKWVSMFDNTLKIKLNPKAQKGKGRQNFLYLENQEDLIPAVTEQFRRYMERKPDITIEDAVRKFDQTGANGKLQFLQAQGIDTNQPLAMLFGGNE